MNKELSDRDITMALHGKIKILTYKDIYNFNTIDDLLFPFDQVVILFETMPRRGHWTTLFKRDSRTIEFFDSYGVVIDDELKFVDKKYRKALKENEKYLTQLVYDSPYNLEYNDHQFQKYDDNIATCGRWVILRLLNKKLTIDDFYKEVKREAKGSTPDKLVTHLIKI